MRPSSWCAHVRRALCLLHRAARGHVTTSLHGSLCGPPPGARMDGSMGRCPVVARLGSLASLASRAPPAGSLLRRGWTRGRRATRTGLGNRSISSYWGLASPPQGERRPGAWAQGSTGQIPRKSRSRPVRASAEESARMHPPRRSGLVLSAVGCALHFVELHGSVLANRPGPSAAVSSEKITVRFFPLPPLTACQHR